MHHTDKTIDRKVLFYIINIQIVHLKCIWLRAHTLLVHQSIDIIVNTYCIVEENIVFDVSINLYLQLR